MATRVFGGSMARVKIAGIIRKDQDLRFFYAEQPGQRPLARKGNRFV
ncbi:MAG: hypothetical protein ACM3TT_09845 [Syntrophothermus sp.]